MADMFKVKIITPERVFYETEASMIEFNTTEGEIGVYAQHIPLTTVLAPGVLRITEEDKTTVAAIHAGFAEILPDQVTLLAEIAEWPDEIDLKRAEEARIRAERRIAEKATDLNMARAELALKRAVARISAVEEVK